MHSSDRSVLVLIFIIALNLSAVARASTDKRLPYSTRVKWIIIVTAMPVIGAIAYLIFSRPSAKALSITEVAEEEGRHRMAGIYEKTKWENR